MKKTNHFYVGCIIGTRPEIIKMIPVIYALKKNKQYKVIIINSGQHLQLMNEMLKNFNLKTDINLKVMKKNQDLSTLTARLFVSLTRTFKQYPFDMIIAQGDTTTTFVAAMTAFYYKIPFAHVEAGLRTGMMYDPFPEEMNRILTSHLATLHFAPTQEEKNNLVKEGIDKHSIFVTGNTVIDTLLYTSKKINKKNLLTKNKLLLLTVHRRDNFGKPLVNIFTAVRLIVEKFPNVEVVYPVHPNPNVKKIAYQLLSKHSRIHLVKPQNYHDFVRLMKSAYLILTDSGGIQEEAPALNKPILILRSKTERPLVVNKNMALIVGANKNKIIKSCSSLITSPQLYRSMQKNKSPYGDGKAALRIVKQIKHYLNKKGR